MFGRGLRRGICLVACVVANAAQGQEIIGSYTAHIGAADMVNSRGAALTQPWQIIRQDRANVHRFGRLQPGDQVDPWFGSSGMRASLEHWARAGMGPDVARAVSQGGVTVEVKVLGYGGRPIGVQVWYAGAGAGAYSGGTSGAASGGAVGGGGIVIE